jgi:uncharacterized membrane protein YhhN
MSVIVLVGLCAVFLAVTLYAEKTDNDRLRYIFKPLASACFIAVAALGGAADGPGAYGPWILIGLVFGAAGDVFLMVRGPRFFLFGLVAFLIGHICYVVAFSRVLPAGEWTTVYAAGPLIAAVAIIAWLWRHLGRMRWPVMAYIAVIVSMMIGAVAILVSDERLLLDDGGMKLLVIGATFFFVSDLFVARQRFVSEGYENRLIGLPTYYVGQMLLAVSTLQ